MLRQRWHAYLILVPSLLAFAPLGEAGAASWKAGTGRVVITPQAPTWMAGYGSRDHPSEGVQHDLWAKALLLEDPSGHRSVIVTLDVCGIDRETSLEIRQAIEKHHGITADGVVLASSHTHCGPVIGTNLITMYRMNASQHEVVKAYTKSFIANVVKAVDAAAAKVEPADVSWDTGRADFAVNRRNNKEADVPKLRAEGKLEGPVDHDVPVLRIRGLNGRNKAIVFGYACHCTVLSFYKFCGDYAGFAQIALEKLYPGSQAMFLAGCGADQNPLPRRTVDIADRYGNQLSEAIIRVVEGPMRPVNGDHTARYEEIPLRFAALPDRAQIEKDAASTTFPVAQRAKKLLTTLDRDGKLPAAYPYPVQLWKLGGLTWVFLGGEVVVDYSLRIKRNLGSSKTWVSSYCNDVMAYIPSLRVLKEGGYEGETAMIYYGQPTKWSEDVETQIMDTIVRLNAPPKP